MYKYLIACDLDGTLLNDESQVSNETVDYLKKLNKTDIKVCIATGRPLRGAMQFYEALDLDTPIITDNGGAICNPKDPNFPDIRLTIPSRVVHKLFRFIEPQIVTAFYSVVNGIYVYKPTDRLNWLYHETDETFMVEGPFTDPKFPEPSGIMFIIKVESMTEFENFLKNETEDLLDFRSWGADTKNAVYEVYQKRTSKAEAVALVAQHYGLTMEHVIAFGDGLNDLDMIELSKYGIAMKNGNPILFDLCYDQTKLTNSENGLIEYLKIFLNQ